MYKIKTFPLTNLDHPSKTFSVRLPTSFQIVALDKFPIGLDVLIDERSPEEPVKFFVVKEGEEIPSDLVRFKECLGSVTIRGWQNFAESESGGLEKGRRYHIFGPRSGGAFTLNPNMRF